MTAFRVSPTPEFLGLQQAVAGRYSIERELGRGTTGIVFLARNVALERPVALKLFPFHLAGDPDRRARFMNEARLAARLSHPNIVPIHTVADRGDVVFFVRRIVDGETLMRRVRRTGPMSSREGRRLVRELALALAYARSAGVVDGEVRPDNVIIERPTGRPMLAEFGISRLPGPGASRGAGEPPAYAALDTRSDVYSLGVTAFYALTGQFPIEARSLAAHIGTHVTPSPPPIATIRAGLPPELAAAVDRCLAADPGQRFATGEELADAVGHARAGDIEIAPAIHAFFSDATRCRDEIIAWCMVAVILSASARASLGVAGLTVVALAAWSVGRLARSARRLLATGSTFEDVRSAAKSEAAQPPDVWWPASRATARARIVVQRDVRRRTIGFTWTTRFGRLFFALAGHRVGRADRRAIAARATATEINLAVAARALFAELPPSAQLELGASQEVIERLQTQITRLRCRERQPAEPLEGARAAVRRTSAIAALENIRLGLLRTVSGLGTPDDLSAHFERARRVEREIALHVAEWGS